MKTKAVILAAGSGMRIKETSGSKPKSLLEIGPVSHEDSTRTTFLERQIRCLKLAGVDEIAVVVGYEKEQIYQKLQGKQVTIIENTHPDINASGSLHSFQFAMNSDFNPLDRKSRTLLLDADIIYEQQMMDLFMGSLSETSLLVCGNMSEDSEEVKAYGVGGRPTFLGKGLTPPLVGDMPCLGEATGIVHFAPADHELVEAIVNWMVGNPKAEPNTLSFKGFGPAKIKTEHEELSQRIMLLGKMKAMVLPKETLFMEVDFAKEYQTVVESFYPKILAADSDYFQSKKRLSNLD